MSVCPSCNKIGNFCCICDDCFTEWGEYLLLYPKEQITEKIPDTIGNEIDFLCNKCYSGFVKYRTTSNNCKICNNITNKCCICIQCFDEWYKYCNANDEERIRYKKNNNNKQPKLFFKEDIYCCKNCVKRIKGSHQRAIFYREETIQMRQIQELRTWGIRKDLIWRKRDFYDTQS